MAFKTVILFVFGLACAQSYTLSSCAPSGLVRPLIDPCNPVIPRSSCNPCGSLVVRPKALPKPKSLLNLEPLPGLCGTQKVVIVKPAVLPVPKVPFIPCPCVPCAAPVTPAPVAPCVAPVLPVAPACAPTPITFDTLGPQTSCGHWYDY